jgi:hypothetical protein
LFQAVRTYPEALALTTGKVPDGHGRYRHDRRSSIQPLAGEHLTIRIVLAIELGLSSAAPASI